MELYVILILCVIILALLAVLLAKTSRNNQAPALQELSRKLDGNSTALDDGFERNRRELSAQLSQMSGQMAEMTKQNYETQIQISASITQNLNHIREANAQETERQSRKLDNAIRTMQESNEKKLDEMRKTVDEKLTETLTTRLNSSFKTVSEQLENVYKSLGEMKELSGGVTDNVKSLNRILTNVKARGTWAEVQLENILEQTIPGMYEKNFQPNAKSAARVEFAVKIPAGGEDGTDSFLPIDSKFPMEDYVRLTSAAESADPVALEEARKALEAAVKREARSIHQYINTPRTTPFAIMYLATEGLYAEISASRTGLPEKLQSEFGVMIAGPTTITALLNSLSMGYRTIAINQKAGEVWKILGVAKKQYDNFGALLEKARRKMDEAGKALDQAQSRNDIIQKKLKTVETLEDADGEILGLSPLAEPDAPEL